MYRYLHRVLGIYLLSKLCDAIGSKKIKMIRNRLSIVNNEINYIVCWVNLYNQSALKISKSCLQNKIKNNQKKVYDAIN